MLTCRQICYAWNFLRFPDAEHINQSPHSGLDRYKKAYLRCSCRTLCTHFLPSLPIKRYRMCLFSTYSSTLHAYKTLLTQIFLSAAHQTPPLQMHLMTCRLHEVQMCGYEHKHSHQTIKFTHSGLITKRSRIIFLGLDLPPYISNLRDEVKQKAASLRLWGLSFARMWKKCVGAATRSMLNVTRAGKTLTFMIDFFF